MTSTIRLFGKRGRAGDLMRGKARVAPEVDTTGNEFRALPVVSTSTARGTTMPEQGSALAARLARLLCWVGRHDFRIVEVGDGTGARPSMAVSRWSNILVV